MLLSDAALWQALVKRNAAEDCLSHLLLYLAHLFELCVDRAHLTHLVDFCHHFVVVDPLFLL